MLTSLPGPHLGLVLLVTKFFVAVFPGPHVNFDLLDVVIISEIEVKGPDEQLRTDHSTPFTDWDPTGWYLVFYNEEEEEHGEGEECYQESQDSTDMDEAALICTN